MTVRLINISKKRVGDIDKNAPLISINDYYSEPPAIPNRDNRPLLFSTFFPGDHAMSSDDKERLMTAERAQKIIEFCIAQRNDGHEAIYVQCGEGRIRSYTVCTVLEDYLHGDVFEHDRENACIKHGIVDRYTFHMMRPVIDGYGKDHVVKEEAS